MNAAHLEFCASPEWRRVVEEMIVPDAIEGVDLGRDVIEVGPGPGFTTDILRGLTERVTAVEVDAQLAGSLAERLAGTNVDVVLGDATSLDLPDNRFTGAASFHMLHHVATTEAQDRVFAELARVLRPGGALVAADGIESDTTRQFHEDDTYHPIDPATLGVRLERAGFASVRVGRHDLGWFCTGSAC